MSNDAQHPGKMGQQIAVGRVAKVQLPFGRLGRDAALSRLKQGFDSPRERQKTQALR
jgi:hypothetical protein